MVGRDGGELLARRIERVGDTRGGLAELRDAVAQLALRLSHRADALAERPRALVDRPERLPEGDVARPERRRGVRHAAERLPERTGALLEARDPASDEPVGGKLAADARDALAEQPHALGGAGNGLARRQRLAVQHELRLGYRPADAARAVGEARGGRAQICRGIGDRLGGVLKRRDVSREPLLGVICRSERLGGSGGTVGELLRLRGERVRVCQRLRALLGDRGELPAHLLDIGENLRCRPRVRGGVRIERALELAHQRIEALLGIPVALLEGRERVEEPRIRRIRATRGLSAGAGVFQGRSQGGGALGDGGDVLARTRDAVVHRGGTVAERGGEAGRALERFRQRLLLLSIARRTREPSLEVAGRARERLPGTVEGARKLRRRRPHDRSGRRGGIQPVPQKRRTGADGADAPLGRRVESRGERLRTGAGRRDALGDAVDPLRQGAGGRRRLVEAVREGGGSLLEPVERALEHGGPVGCHGDPRRLTAHVREHREQVVLPQDRS